LDVDWSKNKAKLHIHEGERLFEGMLVGRTLEESHWITPRICGVCPVAHNLASLRTCEDGLQIKVSRTTELLRGLMFSTQMMQSHMLHLFFLSLPDYLGIDRGTELAKKDPKSFGAALDIKKVSDEIANVVAGRSVHPVTSTIGGFHKIPNKKDLKHLLEEVQKTRASAEHCLNICAKIKFPELKVDLEFIAQKNGNILSSSGEKNSIKDYKRIITEEIRIYSTAKFGTYKNREIMVGSLARLYFSLKDQKLRDLIDFKNPFHNNIAQGIEILYYHKEAEKILNTLIKSKLNPDIVKSKKQFDSYKGIGAVEAPRGGLYHEFRFSPSTHPKGNGDNIITYANIITPTVQNLTSIEKSANALLVQYKNHSKTEKEKLLKMLVRAYDPCITCSVH